MSLTAAVMFVLVGINVATGTVFLVVWWSRRHRAVYFWFGLISLEVAAYIVPRAIRAGLTDLPDVVLTLKWAEAMAQAFYATYPWFIAAYTGVRMRAASLGLVALAAACFAGTLALPFGVNYGEVRGLLRAVQPWGDVVTIVDATPHPVGYVAQTSGFVLCLLLGFYAGVVQWRRGARSDAAPLLACQGISVLAEIGSVAFMVGASTVIQLHELAFTVFIIVMGAHMAKDLRRASREARQLAASLAQAQRLARMGSAEIDLRTGEGTASEEFYRLFGVEPGQTPATLDAMFDLVHPDDRAALRRKIDDVIAQGGRLEADYRIVTPDGRVRWVHGEVMLDPGENGRSPVLRGTVQDVTEQRRSQEALLESERRYRTFFENARDGFMTLGPPDWRFRSANPATVAMFRAPDVETILRASPWELSPELQPDGRRSADVAPELIESALLAGSRHFEWQHRRLDGDLFPASVLLTRLEYGGEVLLQATVRDLTASKQLEAQFTQAQKMDAVGKLAGGVAHDFNNLLQAIVGYGEIALEEIGPTGAGREAVQTVLEAAGRATTLVRQLLAFSRRQVLSLQVVSLADVVADFSKMLRRVIGEHISLEVRIEPGAYTIRADKGQLEQVLMNLCVNARDAMPGGGALTIGLSTVDLGVEFCRQYEWASPGPYAVMEVADTGCGMDAETVQRAFEPFFTTKPPGAGTGLGLSTVFGIVRQHGGIVDVASQPGVGTTVRVYLPCVAEDGAADGEAPVAPIVGGTETILLADDDELVRAAGATVLERAGYTVLVAPDGEAALRLFEAHRGRVELLILDAVMPRLSGREVWDRIRIAHPDLPVLFASGYSLDGLHTNFVLDRGVELVQKPYRAADLLRRVRQLLDARGGRVN